MDDGIANKIFEISGEKDFEQTALELFGHQYQNVFEIYPIDPTRSINTS